MLEFLALCLVGHFPPSKAIGEASGPYRQRGRGQLRQWRKLAMVKVVSSMAGAKRFSFLFI